MLCRNIIVYFENLSQCIHTQWKNKRILMLYIYLIYDFNESLSISECIMSNRRMIIEQWLNEFDLIRGSVCSFAWRNRCNREKPQDNLCPGRYSRRIPPEYKSEVVSLKSTYTVISVIKCGNYVVTTLLRTAFRLCNLIVNNEILCNMSWPILKYYPRISLESLKEAMKPQDSWSPNRVSNLYLPNTSHFYLTFKN